jgi:outer membrane receptor protein involved in Fe transport
MQRYTAGAFVNYEVNDDMKAYSETMLAQISTSAQYGPSADFYTPANISCSNPLLNASELATLCSPTNIAENQALDAGVGATGNDVHLYIGRRDVEGGPRVDDYRSDSFREVLGVKGALGNSPWTYDAYGMVSNTDLDFHHLNNLGTQQLTNALDVIDDPSTGQPACAAAVSGIDPACVPWDVWQPGGVTQASLKYLIIPSDSTTLVREYTLQATTDGDLGQYGVKLPTANEGVKVSFGADYRADWLDFEPDYVRQSGLTSGDAPAPPVHGNFHLWEGFLEGRIPLLADKPFAHVLEADLGYRYSSYNLGFNTSTYKIGLEWSPVRALRVRAGYNRAVRAPNIDELYAEKSIGAGGVADPCWGPTPTLSAAQCALTGVTAAEYGNIAANPAAQINTEGGGNTALKPEIADTYTLGLVYLPENIPALSASVDYYDIVIRDTIEELSSSTILNGCASGIAQFCSLIHRGPTGSLWENIQTQYVEATEQNIGELRTRGLDLNARYGMSLGRFGGINYTLAGSYVLDLITQPTPEASSQYDCVGLFGAQCLNPVPHWRHVFTANWQTPWAGLGFNLRWRYIGPSNVEGTSSNPALQDGYYVAAAHIAAYNYLDLSATIPVVKGVTATLGVNNIADKDPPLAPSGDLSECPVNGCNDNTFPGTYDTLGRYIFAHVEARF